MKEFNQKLSKWQTGLDNAHDALLESREQEVLEDEILRDWILTDDVLFGRLAHKWLDDPIQREGFLDWAIQAVKDEREPRFREAWKNENKSL